VCWSGSLRHRHVLPTDVTEFSHWHAVSQGFFLGVISKAYEDFQEGIVVRLSVRRSQCSR
jgi:hypothetical protein